MTAIITDASTTTQKAVVRVSDYVGSSKTITLTAAPNFTIASGDKIDIYAWTDRITLVDTTTTNTDMITPSQVNAEVDTALSDYDPPTKTEMDSGLNDLNDLSAEQIRTEVNGGISDNHLDHLFATDYNPAAKPGTASALLNELITDDGGVSQFSINSLENAPSGAGAGNSILIQSTTINSVTSQTE